MRQIQILTAALMAVLLMLPGMNESYAQSQYRRQSGNSQRNNSEYRPAQKQQSAAAKPQQSVNRPQPGARCEQTSGQYQTSAECEQTSGQYQTSAECEQTSGKCQTSAECQQTSECQQAGAECEQAKACPQTKCGSSCEPLQATAT